MGEKYFLAIFWWTIPNKIKFKNKSIAKQKLKGTPAAEKQNQELFYMKKKGHLHICSSFLKFCF